jgi:hypothetical protein
MAKTAIPGFFLGSPRRVLDFPVFPFQFQLKRLNVNVKPYITDAGPTSVIISISSFGAKGVHRHRPEPLGAMEAPPMHPTYYFKITFLLRPWKTLGYTIRQYILDFLVKETLHAQRVGLETRNFLDFDFTCSFFNLFLVDCVLQKRSHVVQDR